MKECFAYSSNEYENNATVKLQLTDGQGCVMRNKLLDGFFVRREEGRGGDDPSRIVAYGYLSAFKGRLIRITQIRRGRERKSE